MTDPLICCLTLDPGGRSDFQDRYKRAFASQTYPNKTAMGVDTSGSRLSIGALRNSAVDVILRKRPADIIAHFDWDDVSAPERLQYQLDFMRSTSVPVVGFNDMLFYDAVRDRVLYYDSRMTNYALGTSLFYKREVWERVKFPDCTPEDTTWQHQVGHDNIRGCSSIVDGKPMMIQVLHGGNAAASASGAIFQPASADLDKIVREILANA